MATNEADNFVGTVLAGRYKLVELLGAGGMGAVYRAQHMHLECVRAVKLLLPEHVDNETLVKRFHREARGLSRLQHPNVVKVVDTGQSEDGLPFIAMEFLEGEPLTATLERHGRLPWPTVKHIARQVCQALHAAHEVGIIHRDIKPDNCFRVDGQDDPYAIKLLDFGIARIQRADKATKLTQTGSVMGTLHYMSYEQVAGEVCDRRSDIWSVAVMIYELLTGTLPFMGENMGKIFFAIVQYEPKPVTQAAPHAKLPPQLDTVLGRALEKDVEKRYATMVEFLDALEAIPDTAGTGLGGLQSAAVTTEVQLDNQPTEMYRRPPQQERLHAKVDTDTSEATVDRVTGERVLAAREPAKVVTDTHSSAPSARSKGRRRGAVALAGLLGVSVAVVGGWSLFAGEDAAPVEVGAEAVTATGSLTIQPEVETTKSVSTGGEAAPDDLPKETTGEDEAPTEEQPTEEPAKKKARKSKKAPKKSASSLKERTKKDAQKLAGLLKTLCSSSLSAGDSPKVTVRFHRTGGVDFVDWDPKSKILFQGTSLERCVKRVVKGFSVVPGADRERSVKRVIGFRR